MGPEIIVISGFRKNRGQKSADLVISEPRNNSSSNLLELGLFDFWILRRTSIACHQCLLCTWYDTCLLHTSPIIHNKESRTHMLRRIDMTSHKIRSGMLPRSV